MRRRGGAGGRCPVKSASSGTPWAPSVPEPVSGWQARVALRWEGRGQRQRPLLSARHDFRDLKVSCESSRCHPPPPPPAHTHTLILSLAPFSVSFLLFVWGEQKVLEKVQSRAKRPLNHPDISNEFIKMFLSPGNRDRAHQDRQSQSQIDVS